VQVLRDVGKQEEEEEEEEAIILTMLLLVLIGRAPMDTSLRCDTTRSKALVRLLLLVLVVVGGGTRYAHAMAGLDHRATTAQQHSNTACGVRRMIMMLSEVGF